MTTQISLADAQAYMQRELQSQIAMVSGVREHKSLEAFVGLQGVRYEVWNQRKKVLDTRSLVLAVEAYNAPHLAAEIALREPAAPTPQLVIEVQGGAVKQVISGMPLEVSVVDRDTEGCGYVSIIEGEAANLQSPEVVVDVDHLATLAQELGGPAIDADLLNEEAEWTVEGGQFGAAAKADLALYLAEISICRSEPDASDDEARRKCHGTLQITPKMGGAAIKIPMEWSFDPDESLASILENDVTLDYQGTEDLKHAYNKVSAKPARSTLGL